MQSGCTVLSRLHGFKPEERLYNIGEPEDRRIWISGRGQQESGQQKERICEWIWEIRKTP